MAATIYGYLCTESSHAGFPLYHCLRPCLCVRPCIRPCIRTCIRPSIEIWVLIRVDCVRFLTLFLFCPSGFLLPCPMCSVRSPCRYICPTLCNCLLYLFVHLSLSVRLHILSVRLCIVPFVCLSVDLLKSLASDPSITSSWAANWTSDKNVFLKMMKISNHLSEPFWSNLKLFGIIRWCPSHDQIATTSSNRRVLYVNLNFHRSQDLRRGSVSPLFHRVWRMRKLQKSRNIFSATHWNTGPCSTVSSFTLLIPPAYIYIYLHW